MKAHSCSISTLQKLKQEDCHELRDPISRNKNKAKKQEPLCRDSWTGFTTDQRQWRPSALLHQGAQGSGQGISGWICSQAPQLCPSVSPLQLGDFYAPPLLCMVLQGRDAEAGGVWENGRQELAKRKSCRLRAGVGLGSNLLPQWLRELEFVLLHPLTSSLCAPRQLIQRL